MDTNLLATNIVQAIQAAKMGAEPTVTALNWNLIVMGIIGLVTTLVSSVTAVLVARVSINTKKTVENSEETKKSAGETAEGVKQIHVAVNSERTAMLEKVEKLRDEILVISKQKVVLEEQQKAGPAASFTKEQIAQIIKALEEHKQSL